MTAPKTRGQAIRAMCKDCIYDPCSPGTWVQQAEACTSPECPLFTFRPRSKAAKTPEHSETANAACAPLPSDSLTAGSEGAP
jgi:hypothetical protein